MVIKNNAATVAQAIERLNDKQQHEGAKDRKAVAVLPSVKKQLEDFCRQNAAFAEAVLSSKGTLGECCEKAVSGCGNSISDIETYRRSVQYYIPDARIEFKMQLIMDKSPVEPSQKAIVLNLFDLV